MFEGIPFVILENLFITVYQNWPYWAFLRYLVVEFSTAMLAYHAAETDG